MQPPRYTVMTIKDHRGTKYAIAEDGHVVHEENNYNKITRKCKQLNDKVQRRIAAEIAYED